MQVVGLAINVDRYDAITLTLRLALGYPASQICEGKNTLAG